jgi:excisionase family DNA binding protein
MPSKKPEPGSITPVFDPRQWGVFKAGYSVNEAADILSLGLTRTYDLIHTGRLKAVKSGKRTIVLGVSIAEFLRDLAEEGRKLSKSPNPKSHLKPAVAPELPDLGMGSGGVR